MYGVFSFGECHDVERGVRLFLCHYHDKISPAMIYFDHAANTKPRKEVLEIFLETEKQYEGNTNSLHPEGEKAKAYYEALNAKVLSLLGLDPAIYEVVYTSSATESNNLAIKGLYESYSGYGNRMLSSEFEHSSTNGALAYLKDKGADVRLVTTKEDGTFDEMDLQEKLTPSCLLFALSAVEGELGTIQDIHKAQSLVDQFENAHLLVDATQAIGKIPLSLQGIDMVSFAPHKFGGIIGTGALVKKKDIILTPLLHGGKSASLYRSGTVALGLIASLEKALELALTEEKENFEKVKTVHRYLWGILSKDPHVLLNSTPDNPYFLNLSILGKNGGDSVAYFAKHDICISQKSACSPSSSPSKSVMAKYHQKPRALSSFRLSFGPENTIDEAKCFLSYLEEWEHE